MLEYLLSQTNLKDFLSNWELSQLRQSCRLLKEILDKRVYPLTWVQTCRFCDPNVLWHHIMDRRMVSCYQPQILDWVVICWGDKLPSIIPSPFWSYFLRFMKGYVSMTQFRMWGKYTPHPVTFPDRSSRWQIGMKMEIVGNSFHNEEFYPEELKDIDEFISIGVSIYQPQHIHESILGLNQHSMGWHSDDGNIYMDSLLIGEASQFGKGDTLVVSVDYYNGLVLFEKNSKLIYIQEISGAFLYNPLLFTVVCKTMNQLFLSIV